MVKNNYRYVVLGTPFCAASLRANLLFGPPSDVLIGLGAASGERILQHREVWRLFSGIWLHSGLLHLVANMVSLLVIGCHMERVHGGLCIGSVYVIMGVFGSLASAISAPSTASVGASSAVFGLSKAVVGDIHMYRALSETPVIFLRRVCFVVAIQLCIYVAAIVHLAIGAAASFEYESCVSGLLMGFVMSATVLKGTKPEGSKGAAAADSDAAMEMPTDVPVAPA